jgi:hypothetical protein
MRAVELVADRAQLPLLELADGNAAPPVGRINASAGISDRYFAKWDSSTGCSSSARSRCSSARRPMPSLHRGGIK